MSNERWQWWYRATFQHAGASTLEAAQLSQTFTFVYERRGKR